MNETVIDARQLTRIHRDTDAGSIGHAVYDDLSQLLESLPEDAWNADTVCEGWTVAHIVRHIVGAAKSHISTRELVRQAIAGNRRKGEFGGSALDATNEIQIGDHAGLPPTELVAEVTRLGPLAVGARMAKPKWLRRIGVPNPIAGNMPSGVATTLRLGHLFDVVLTRDIWMHRIDIARATGSELTLGPTDRRVVEDIVAEWLGMQPNALELTLTGPIGARYRSGTDGDSITMDAIEFTWIMAGRGPAPHPAFDRKVLF